MSIAQFLKFNTLFYSDAAKLIHGKESIYKIVELTIKKSDYNIHHNKMRNLPPGSLRLTFWLPGWVNEHGDFALEKYMDFDSRSMPIGALSYLPYLWFVNRLRLGHVVQHQGHNEHR